MQDVNERNADENKMPAQSQFDWEKNIYNPFVERNARLLMHSLAYANLDIPAGSEIKENRLFYAGAHQWKEAVLGLRAKCTAEEGVAVSE
jgi:hypothetical protein